MSPLWPRTSARSGTSSAALRRPRPAGRPAPRRRAGSRRAPPATRCRRPRCPAPAPPRAPASSGSTSRRSSWRRTPSATASAPRTGAHLAGQRELADDRARLDRLRVQLSGRDEQRDRERQVERRADLAQVGRREVDRDPPQRELVARVHHRRPDALARLAHRLVGEPDDGERGQPEPDVGLDPDAPCVTPSTAKVMHAGRASERGLQVVEADEVALGVERGSRRRRSAGRRRTGGPGTR